MDDTIVRARKGKASTSDNCNTSVLNGGYNSNEGDNIKVFVRIRPPSKEIQDGDNDMCLEVTSPNSLTISTKPEPKQFSYDQVAGMKTTQEEVFSTVGKGIIEQFVGGFNGTIFAYGQTGSGKTFTMLGPADNCDNFSHELRGVIPRGFEYIFSLMNRQQEKVGDRVEFLAKCSFLEIYNESVYDLLEPSTAGLALRENIKKGVFVEGLAERTVVSAKEAYTVLQSGWLNRRVASTSMNRESSRSHAVFTVSLESKTRNGGVANIKESKLHLVDLAGSERQKDTQTEDVRLKEAGSINKSLSALGNVIMALVDIAHGKTRYIHYRDSKLTFILRDSLGGNAKTYIIANVHPSSRCFGETLSTLNFARRAKMIKNKAIINEDVTGNVAELQAEIKKLKELLQAKSRPAADVKVEDDTAVAPSEVTTTQSYNEDTTQWQEMMMGAIAARENAECEKLALQEKITKLEELGEKKEKFLQSTRMILKFRTQHIAKLERKLKKELGAIEEDTKDKQIKALKDEIKCLQISIEHHPEVKKFAIENLELRAEIKRLKASDPSNGDFTKEMSEKHRYTLQLERQLRELMNTKENDLSNSQQSLEASNAEIEKIKIELAQVQSKLETTKEDLVESRQSLQQASEELITKTETFLNREMEIQSELAAVNKTKNELERTLESFQLKTAVERTTMNSLHLQTVKTLASPRKFGTPRSFASPRCPTSSLGKANSTPLKERLLNATDTIVSTAKENGHIINKSDNSSIYESASNGHPEKGNDSKKSNSNSSGLLQDVSPPKCMSRSDSLNDISVSDNDQEEYPFWDIGSETRDDEIIYIETLQEEIKKLQELYDQSIETLRNEQKSKIPLVESITKLTHNKKELEELLKAERKSYTTKEGDLTSQLNSVKDKYKETIGSSTILKSEVEDLRIMYKSICKQLDTTKKSKDEQHIESGRKHASIESELLQLQVDHYNLKSDLDKTVESNNNLQCDYDECKEELQFSRHNNNKLKEMINQEKKNVKEAEDRLQSALEKLRHELETKIMLTQENKQEELMKLMETINELREQLQNSTKTCEEQEKTINKQTKDLEKARCEVAAQKWLNLSDKEAINNFMKNVQELHETIKEKQNLVISLQSENEDLRQEHENLQVSHNEKKRKYQSLADSLKVESEKLAKERVQHEKEVSTLHEEIRMAQHQCKELTCTLDNHQRQIHALQGEDVVKSTELCEKIIEIKSLEENIAELKQNNEVSQASQENYITANENLTHLTESWDAVKVEMETENKSLQDKVLQLQSAESERELLENRVSVLEVELEDSENQRKEKQDRVIELECDLKQFKEMKEEKESSLEAALVNVRNLWNDKNSLEKEISSLKMNLCNKQDDLDVNVEELEKTKVLEQKYFEENTYLFSKLSVAEELKTTYEKQIRMLNKNIDGLEMEKAKLVAHQNNNQRIDHLVSIKKENNELREKLRKVSKANVMC